MTTLPSPHRATLRARWLTTVALALTLAVGASALHPTRAGAAAGESQGRSVQAGAIAAGAYSSCALRGGGRIACWGAGDHGQLGSGDKLGDNAGALVVSGIDDATQIAFGAVHGCAIRTGRTVWCWGGDDQGQLGTGAAPGAASDATTPVQVPGITDAIAITAMNAGTCVLHAAGRVSCWGDNDGGEIGGTLPATPADRDVLSPRLVTGLDDVVAIDAGWWHVCAVKRDGTLWCWGFNGDGQVGQASDAGDPATLRRPVPQQVPGVSDAVAVSGGVYQTCFVRKTGAIACMGSDAIGEAGLGAPSATSSSTPRAVVGLGGKAVQVSTGQQLVCALLDTGAVQCWGNDSTGGLGDDTPTVHAAAPRTVHDLTASAISVDRLTPCAISRAGSVSCWGDDTWSNVGNGGDVEGQSPGVAGVLELTTPYGRVAALTPTITAPSGTVAEGQPTSATITVENDGPDTASPVVQLSTDRRLELGTTLHAGVDAAGDHGATWRPGPIAAGKSATITLPLNAVDAGSSAVRALVTSSDALDPRRPLDRGPFADGQRTAASVTIAAAIPPTPAVAPALAPASGAAAGVDGAKPPTPLAALDPKMLIALQRPNACHRTGTPLRITLSPPAGATIRSATAGRKGHRAAALTGQLRGAVRLPAKVTKSVEGPRGTSRSLVVSASLSDGRSTSRTLTVRTCR